MLTEESTKFMAKLTTWPTGAVQQIIYLIERLDRVAAVLVAVDPQWTYKFNRIRGSTAWEVTIEIIHFKMCI